MSVDKVEYDKEYFDRKAERKDLAGEILVDKLMDVFPGIEMVVDYGCGDGRLTKNFENEGIPVLGLDYSEAAIENNVLTDAAAAQVDLRKPVKLFNEDNILFDEPVNIEPDFAVCIEVAEHLEEEHADMLVENVTRYADNVFFTAAAPGQPGRGHVNCRLPSYWIRRFEENGFVFDEETTNSLKNYFADTALANATPWIVRNLLIFRRE